MEFEMYNEIKIARANQLTTIIEDTILAKNTSEILLKRRENQISYIRFYMDFYICFKRKIDRFDLTSIPIKLTINNDGKIIMNIDEGKLTTDGKRVAIDLTKMVLENKVSSVKYIFSAGDRMLSIELNEPEGLVPFIYLIGTFTS